MKLSNILALALVVGLATPAFAKGGGGSGITFIPSFSIDTSSSKTTGSAETTNSTTVISGKLGYTLGNGIYVGGVYSSSAISEKTGTEVKTNLSGFGASVGWIHSSGFNIIASYLLSASGDTNTSPKAEYTGTGMAVDMGYSFMFGSWGFGPQVSYGSYTFDEVKYDGALSSGTEQEFTSLGIGLQFMFMF